MKNDNTPAALPTVHRFAAAAVPMFKARMNEGAEILDVTVGSKGLNFYAMVDAAKDREWRYFLIVGTGQPVPHGWELVHVKTVIAGGPALHIFGVPKHIAKSIGFKKFAEPAKDDA